MIIGVLALQGDFDAHRRRLEELGAKVVLVKKPEQLDEIDGLVIPEVSPGPSSNCSVTRGSKSSSSSCAQAHFRHLRRRDSARRPK